VRLVPELEYNILLQSKPLPSKKSPEEIQEIVIKIQESASVVSTVFVSLCKEVNSGVSWNGIQSLVTDIRSKMNVFFYNNCPHNTTSLIRLPGYIHRNNRICEEDIEEEVKLTEKKLLFICDNMSSANSASTVSKLVKIFGATFSSLVKVLLGLEIKKCLSSVNNSDNDSVNICLNSLLSLSLQGNSLCSLLVNNGTVDWLINKLRSREMTSHLSSVLRILGSLCCVGEAVKYLINQGGFNLLLTILKDEHCEEDLRREAVGVIAQITSPLLENKSTEVVPIIEHNME